MTGLLEAGKACWKVFRLYAGLSAGITSGTRPVWEEN